MPNSILPEKLYENYNPSSLAPAPVVPPPPAKSDPILITGAAGFIGRNLTARLRANGYTNLLLFDLTSPEGALADYAKRAVFVFHLAGVNRPKDALEFYTGNAGLTETLLNLLWRNSNQAPVLLSSSAQAGNGSDYAKSKESAEASLLAHGAAGRSMVYPFRLPGVFGKWSRPAYNSVVATFCHNIARGLPLEIRDRHYTLPLCYIDDVVDAFLSALQGPPNAPKQGDFYSIAPLYTQSLGMIADSLAGFAAARQTLAAPPVGDDFTRKLYATYLSYLPENKVSYPLNMKTDSRGSFTEFMRAEACGQMSVNRAKPGIVKGNHWHDTKNEKFLVVAGSAVIRQRRLGSSEIIETHTSGDALCVVDILPGYTHNIENTGTDDLVTLMWASEPFDPNRPDTWFEEV